MFTSVLQQAKSWRFIFTETELSGHTETVVQPRPRLWLSNVDPTRHFSKDQSWLANPEGHRKKRPDPFHTVWYPGCLMTGSVFHGVFYNRDPKIMACKSLTVTGIRNFPHVLGQKIIKEMYHTWIYKYIIIQIIHIIHINIKFLRYTYNHTFIYRNTNTTYLQKMESDLQIDFFFRGETKTGRNTPKRKGWNYSYYRWRCFQSIW